MKIETKKTDSTNDDGNTGDIKVVEKNAADSFQETIVFNKIKYRAVKIRLLVNLPADFGYWEYMAGFEMIAGCDKDGRVCVPTIEDNGKKDIAYLKDGEYEIDESIKQADSTDDDSEELEVAADSSDEIAAKLDENAESFDPETSTPVAVSASKSSAKSFESDDSPPDIHAAELAYLEAGHECERIADEIARLQAEHEIAIDRRKSLGVDLCRVLEKRLRETLDETECEVKIKDDSSSSDTSSKPSSDSLFRAGTSGGHRDTISEKPTGDYSGLSAPISELWKTPIPRFGDKKKASLLEACPTIGDFEKLREQAGRSFKPLSELLPDFIGQDMADELEERQLTWLKQNASRLVPVERSSGNDGDETEIEIAENNESTIGNQPQTESGETESDDSNIESQGEGVNQDSESGDRSPYSFG